MESCEANSDSVLINAIKNYEDPKTPPELPYKCDQCPKRFRTYPGLRSHVGMVHKTTVTDDEVDEDDDDEDSGKKVVKKSVCDMCGQVFVHRNQLSRHKRKVHAEEKAAKGQVKNAVKCGKCEKSFANVLKLCAHLKDDHEMELRIQQLFFESMDEFDAWRKKHETEKRFEFRRWYKKAEEHKIYFYCHRSGHFKSVSKGVRPKKSNRIEFHCSAFAFAVITDAGVQVKSCLEHYGHDNDLARLHIPKETREKIYQYIRDDKSFEWIQQTLRENMEKTKDGHSIELRENVFNKSDMFNVINWLRRRAVADGRGQDVQWLDLWKASNLMSNSGLLSKKTGSMLDAISKKFKRSKKSAPTLLTDPNRTENQQQHQQHEEKEAAQASNYILTHADVATQWTVPFEQI